MPNPPRIAPNGRVFTGEISPHTGTAMLLVLRTASLLSKPSQYFSFSPFQFFGFSLFGGFRLGLLLTIAVSAGAFACVLALPAHSLRKAYEVDGME